MTVMPSVTAVVWLVWFGVASSAGTAMRASCVRHPHSIKLTVMSAAAVLVILKQRCVAMAMNLYAPVGRAEGAAGRRNSSTEPPISNASDMIVSIPCHRSEA